MIRTSVFILATFFSIPLMAQEITFSKKAALAQVYLDSVKAEGLLPMNELNVESGYVLYKAEITIESEGAVLELENVRDYAVVFVDGLLQGTMTDNGKKINLEALPGKHQLQLYVENIGRITYGPEILDNSKGLFGRITLDGQAIENWTMIPLNIRNCEVKDLTFDSTALGVQSPCFYKGTFRMDVPQNTYLDISGWGMGEVWINHKYSGSYWEQEKQQSLQIRSEDLVQGENEIIIFEVKNQQKYMSLSKTPVFK
ncbi:hypothetical protein ACSBL2_25855 [Pedobacter sp. AW31-3R]|uniref:hypothetical protein n=1 Tax=Pedobacter sp. AW31-3R TaxID=3445781 RepID=UPI003FA094FA